MKEIAGDAAILVDPRSTPAITEALTRAAEDPKLRQSLSASGIQRAAQYSWQNTARLTLDVYAEAAGTRGQTPRPLSAPHGLEQAIEKTVQYARLFQYPLKPDELHDRLFDVKIPLEEFHAALKTLRYKPDAAMMELRVDRERISGQAIAEAEPHLRTLASMPFIRMIAFSGSTAHRNMTNMEDIDLFLIVEDGKLWAAFLIAMLWAKAKGLRKTLCMNYLISDAALPLAEHDAFTAQQLASLKPFYGKEVYERFVAANPFVSRCFPNFDPARHRDVYREIVTNSAKPMLERVLRMGPIQLLDRMSRFVLQNYLGRKVNAESDVQLDRRRMKLHLHSNRQAVLDSIRR
jgi:hypothetical protein